MMQRRRRCWGFAAVAAVLCLANVASGRRSILEVTQTCHDRNAKHCDYLVEKMTCDPHDVAVKKTLLLNCGNTCRAQIEMCKNKDPQEAEDEKKAQLLIDNDEEKLKEAYARAAEELKAWLSTAGPSTTESDETADLSVPAHLAKTLPPTPSAASATPAAPAEKASSSPSPTKSEPAPEAPKAAATAGPAVPVVEEDAPFSRALEPNEDSIDGFWKNHPVAADLRRFQRTCEPLMGSKLGSWLDLYKSLDRVLFIDASCNHHSVGLGTLIGDYESWFTWGFLSHRAVFVKYNECGGDAKGTCTAFDEEGASAGVGDPACGRVDLGKFFTGPGEADWSLNDKTVSKVAAEMAKKGAHERFLRAPLDLGADPERFFRDNLMSGNHPWVTLKVEWGNTLIPRSPKGVEGHPNFEEEAVGEGFWGAAEKLGVALPKTAAEGGARNQFAALEQAHRVHIRGCLLHAILRPRAALQAALQPYLDRIGEVAGFVAMHVRTGYADIKTPTATEQIKEVQAALSNPKAPAWDRYFNGDLNERWAALNELLAAELPRANDSPELAGCAGREKLDKPFVMGDGGAKGLNPFFTCAGQAAQAAAAKKVANGERPPGWEDKWAVYVSTDSPGLNQLVVGISGLHGHIIGCQHACDVHHSAHHGTQTETSELHTMVDLYILGLADHVVPVTRSSFQRFADRGFGVGDRPQFLSGVAAPDPPALPELDATKRHENRLPVCKAAGGGMEDDAKEGDTVCQKFRWALFSEWISKGDPI